MVDRGMRLNIRRLCLPLVGAIILGAAVPAVGTQIAPISADQSSLQSAREARQERINKAFAAYTERYYEKLSAIQNSEVRKLEWQSKAAEVTLWLVVFVVISGVALSAYQLWWSLRANKSVEDVNLEISTTTLRVTSSIAGIAILVISIAFLYLFLRDVYTMKPWDLRAMANKDPRGSANQSSYPGKAVPPTDVMTYRQGDPNFAAPPPPAE